jgi:hypothetical protein
VVEWKRLLCPLSVIDDAIINLRILNQASICITKTIALTDASIISPDQTPNLRA